MKINIDGVMIDMLPIESKLMGAVGYDEGKRLMAFEFKRGPVYVYNDVPKDIFEGQLSAASPDDYFNTTIKNAFTNKRVG